MKYFPLTNLEKQDMIKFLGIKDIKELFCDIPQSKAYYSLDDIPGSLSEEKLLEKFQNISKKNLFTDYLSFLGGGAYNHFIPETVNYLSSKGEFLTPYTPYQPEVSQGSLQAMFEYQTMMTMLTALDISNSSLYDGGTASAEGALLAIRKSKKNRLLIASNLHPEYSEIINTYLQNLDIDVQVIGFDINTGKVNLNELEKNVDENIAGFIFQSPNFFGIIENSNAISEIVHQKKAYSVQVVAEAMSLPFLSPPGENDVDIAVGEVQSFGLPLWFGGPYLGFITAKKEFLRQMPGRIVGQTTDSKGRRGYVLTLATREQHIKREKATSNICTNQAWCALRTAIYLSLMGETGLRKIAKANHLNTAYFKKEIKKYNQVKIKYDKDFFNEVVLDIIDLDIENFVARMEEKNIAAGIPLKWFFPDFKNSLLINFTEIHKKKDIDRLVKAIGECCA